MICLVLIYTLNYFIGKSANKKMVQYWVQENKEIFDLDFSHVGIGAQSGGPYLDQESAHCYKFYASGRINCSYALITLEVFILMIHCKNLYIS